MTEVSADVRRTWIRVDGETISFVECPVCFAVLFQERAERHYKAAHPSLQISVPWRGGEPS